MFGTGASDDLIKTVKENSNHHDYRLVAAIIAKESAFDQNAKSPVGALGLMQVMPEVAEALYDQSKEECGLDRPNLFDPANNIRYGTCLLKRLEKRYSGDIDLILAHYNGGGDAAYRVKNFKPLNKETANYINIVKRKMGVCRRNEW